MFIQLVYIVAVYVQKALDCQHKEPIFTTIYLHSRLCNFTLPLMQYTTRVFNVNLHVLVKYTSMMKKICFTKMTLLNRP